MKTRLASPIELELEPQYLQVFPSLQAARRPRIVIAEDCDALSHALRRHFRRANYVVHVVHDGLQAFRALAELEPDVLLLDLGLPRMHGLKLLHELRSTRPRLDAPVIVLTGDTNPESWERALSLGARRLLLKPTPAESVVAAIDEVLEETR